MDTDIKCESEREKEREREGERGCGRLSHVWGSS